VQSQYHKVYHASDYQLRGNGKSQYVWTIHTRLLSETPQTRVVLRTDIVCHDEGLSQNSPRSHVIPYSTLHGSWTSWAIRSYVPCYVHKVSLKAIVHPTFNCQETTPLGLCLMNLTMGWLMSKKSGGMALSQLVAETSIVSPHKKWSCDHNVVLSASCSLVCP
jgi:hypothetical protein